VITATTSTARTDTAQAAAAAAAAGKVTPAGGAMGKDQFLKLLLAQMKNQDPMNPMAGDQMATQLATFSSLEQLQNINATLTSQQTSSGSLLGAIQASAAVNTIGHTVIAAGDSVEIGGSNGSTNVTADMAYAGAKGTLHIYDSTGKEVGSRELGAVKGGRQTIDLGSAANGLGDGDYTYSIDMKDATGNAVAVQTFTTAKIDGVSSTPTGLMLNAGGLAIPYAKVVQIIK
jgi:flagellar basal-body rod modification protein FlgD